MEDYKKRILAFVRGDQKYIFRYTPGDEDRLLGVFAEMASTEDLAFDWLDVARLTHKLSCQDLEERVK